MKKFDGKRSAADGFALGTAMMLGPAYGAAAEANAAEQNPTCATIEADIRDWFAKADTDHDGVLSHEEFAAAPMLPAVTARGPGGDGSRGDNGGRAAPSSDVRFDRLDINHDGALSTGERDAARAQPHDRWQHSSPATPSTPAN